MVTRRLVKGTPRHIKVGIMLAVLLWGWYWFKQVEPRLMPVVSDFAITGVDREQDGEVWIRGTMSKVRDCDFVQVAAYSGATLLDLYYTETQEQVNRIPGVQTWGWWIVTPDVTGITLYADHDCATGRVRTTLFDGVIR